MTSLILHSEQIAAVQAKCLRLLALREHSQLQLRQKLQPMGFAENVINEVLERLVVEGWQSDDRFAEAYQRARLARGYGLARIRQELRIRGIEALPVPEEGSVALKADANIALQRLYAKKYRDLPPASPKEKAARMRFLLQRGYSMEDIQSLFHSSYENS